MAFVVQNPVDQMTVNRYRTGSSLKPHIDLSRFRDGIFILSLEASALMTFELDRQAEHCLLHPGDLLVLQGPARYTVANLI